MNFTKEIYSIMTFCNDWSLVLWTHCFKLQKTHFYNRDIKSKTSCFRTTLTCIFRQATIKRGFYKVPLCTYTSILRSPEHLFCSTIWSKERKGIFLKHKGNFYFTDIEWPTIFPTKSKFSLFLAAITRRQRRLYTRVWCPQFVTDKWPFFDHF